MAPHEEDSALVRLAELVRVEGYKRHGLTGQSEHVNAYIRKKLDSFDGPDSGTKKGVFVQNVQYLKARKGGDINKITEADIDKEANYAPVMAKDAVGYLQDDMHDAPNGARGWVSNPDGDDEPLVKQNGKWQGPNGQGKPFSDADVDEFVKNGRMGIEKPERSKVEPWEMEDAPEGAKGWVVNPDSEDEPIVKQNGKWSNFDDATVKEWTKSGRMGLYKPKKVRLPSYGGFKGLSDSDDGTVSLSAAEVNRYLTM